ncbi:MAG: TonB-dependent receptor [Bacteroidia bacterium]
MNKSLYWIGLWLIWPSILSAQMLTLRDLETRSPLAGVAVARENSETAILTDARGQADLAPLRDAPAIVLYKDGYETARYSYAELAAAPTVYLAPRLIRLDEVVLSGTRWEQARREVPGKITTLDQRFIQLQQPQTAADLLGASGEVFIQKSQQGGGSPMIRGFATNRLLIAVDGVRMNTAIFRSGNLQNVISIDPLATARTEVLYGPGSVVYGSDAIGGVMSFYTLDPALADSDVPRIDGKALTRFSSANQEVSTHADVMIGWRKWAVATSISYNRFGDLRMGSHGPEEYLRPFYVQRVDTVDRVVANPDPLVQRPTGYEQINLTQKLRFRPHAHWDLRYGFHYATTTDYSRYDRLVRTRQGLPRSAEWYYGPQVWLMNHVSVRHERHTWLYDELSLGLAQQHFEESRIDRDFGDYQRRTRLEAVDAYSLNLDLRKSLGAHTRLMYGAEIVHNDVASTGTDEDIRTGIVVPGPARYPQARWTSLAAFATVHQHLASQWTAQAGLRYNHFLLDATFDDRFYDLPFATATLDRGALTGSAGVVWTPADPWHLGASLATGFRSPNVDDLGKVFDSAPGLVVVPNPGLEPEYAYNGEIDLSRTFGERLKIDVVAFYTLLDNALVRRDFRLGDRDSILYAGEMSRVQAVQNAARATVFGVQAGAEAVLGSGFSLVSRFNFQQGEEELDDGTTSPLRHAAPWYGQTRLQYRAEGLSIQVAAVYSGGVAFEDLPQEEQGKDYLYAIDADGNPYAPAWLIFNLKMQYQTSEIFAIHAGIENLADLRYRPYSSGIVAPGRNVILAVQATF